MPRLAAGLALLALLLLAAPASAADAGPADDLIYGVTNTDHLVSFLSTTPGTLVSDRAITRPPAPERILGMDLSPRDGDLYVLTRNPLENGAAKLYVLDSA